MKPGAWLIDQRQRRQAGDPLVRRERVVDLRAERLRVGARDRAAMKVADTSDPSDASADRET